MNFIEKCVLGQIKYPLEEIDNYIEEWHNDQKLHIVYPELYYYLGMTKGEYYSWLMDANNLSRIIRSRKDGSFEMLQLLDEIDKNK